MLNWKHQSSISPPPSTKRSIINLTLRIDNNYTHTCINIPIKNGQVGSGEYHQKYHLSLPAIPSPTQAACSSPRKQTKERQKGYQTGQDVQVLGSTMRHFQASSDGPSPYVRHSQTIFSEDRSLAWFTSELSCSRRSLHEGYYRVSKE